MLRMIHAELKKLLKNRTFKILCGVAIFIGCFVVVMSSPMVTDFLKQQIEEFSVEDQELLQQSMVQSTYNQEQLISQSLGLRLQTQDVFNPLAIEVYYSSYGDGIIEILIGILVGAMFAKEYSSGTFKNVLAYGQKRSHVYLAKFVASSVGVFILLLLQVGVSTALYTTLFGWKEAFEVSQLTHMLGSFATAYIAFISIVSFMMLIATLVKSNASLIGITVGIFVFLTMILLSIYGNFVDLFDQIFEWTPIYNTRAAVSINAVSADWIKSIILSVITSVICLAGGIQIFNKQDIK